MESLLKKFKPKCGIGEGVKKYIMQQTFALESAFKKLFPSRDELKLFQKPQWPTYRKSYPLVTTKRTKTDMCDESWHWTKILGHSDPRTATIMVKVDGLFLLASLHRCLGYILALSHEPHWEHVRGFVLISAQWEIVPDYCPGELKEHWYALHEATVVFFSKKEGVTVFNN